MNIRFWFEAFAEPNRMAAQVLTTSPINVSTLGLMRESASQRTIVSSRTPQARPKALVQLSEGRLIPAWLIAVWLIAVWFVAPGEEVAEEAAEDAEVAIYAFASFDVSPSISSWIVASFRIFSSRFPLGETTMTSSPTFLFSNARPIGDVVEIFPVATSDSSLVTSLYSSSSFLVLSKTLIVERRPTRSRGMLFMFTIDRSARRLPN